MNLDEARRGVGRTVVYATDPTRPEYGTIIRVNDRYVFVRYAGDVDGAKATRAEDLTWA